MDSRKIKDWVLPIGAILALVLLMSIASGELNWESVKWLLSVIHWWGWILIALTVCLVLLEMAFGEYDEPPRHYRDRDSICLEAQFREEDSQYNEYKKREPKRRNFCRIFVSIIIISIGSCVHFG